MNGLRKTMAGTLFAATMLSAFALAGPAQAGSNGKRNTALVLGAVTANELLRGHTANAIVAGAATAYAYSQYEDARRYDDGYGRYDRGRRYRGDDRYFDDRRGRDYDRDDRYFDGRRDRDYDRDDRYRGDRDRDDRYRGGRDDRYRDGGYRGDYIPYGANDYRSVPGGVHYGDRDYRAQADRSRDGRSRGDLGRRDGRDRHRD